MPTDLVARALPRSSPAPTTAHRGAHRASVGDHRLQRLGPPIVAVVLVAIMHGSNLMGYPAFFDDEGTYYSQAMAVARDGELAPYTYWYDHPPFGWLQLAPLVALVEWVTPHHFTLFAARSVMIAYAAATAGLLYALARRLQLGRLAAVAAVLLWGLSPLTMTLSRQVYLDNVALPWLLGAFVLVLNRRRDVLLHLAAGAVFAGAVLTKETLVLAMPGLLYALVRVSHRRLRVFSVVGAVMSFCFVGLAYLIFAGTRDELLPGAGHVSMWEGIVWQLGARTGSGSVFDPTSAARDVVDSWTSVDSVLIMAGLGAAALCLAMARFRSVGLIVLVTTAVGLRPSGYLPAMYIVALLPFFAVAVVGVLTTALGMVRSRPGRTAGRVLLAAAAGLLVLAWTPGWRYVVTTDDTADYRAALGYIDENVAPDAVIIADNVFFNDLIAAGRPSDGWSGPVWFPKYDLDPETYEELPERSADVDYVISNFALRVSGGGQTDLKKLLSDENSRVVATFGEGVRRIEVREVTSP